MSACSGSEHFALFFLIQRPAEGLVRRAAAVNKTGNSKHLTANAARHSTVSQGCDVFLSLYRRIDQPKTI